MYAQLFIFCRFAMYFSVIFVRIIRLKIKKRMETITSLYDFFTECGQVTTDSRNCPEGSMFIALKGGNFNGNAFAEQALQKVAAMRLWMNRNMHKG